MTAFAGESHRSGARAYFVEARTGKRADLSRLSP
jgi:hypothetical protein